ncbi:MULTISPECIES: ABC transporter ATP-binding protein [unclassified Isoptericola]|uniref:ABC transporter ATP-binding protein n=1 Tax=unclassified Isoptericola TaxID=2623355 RepID=UPI0027143C56|nr:MULTISPECIES: ABC transporter ATP-binding protein [unclassified Isoptericola]MDO8144983.1 ABC transporter ATP-binding protein [Isoptericola sp. 178]MDO8148616.1 ABC transporter ATP-binding protein [Isoptericola sp. b515]MDO8151438.1 ABC transporter ATP-binding protein [Isoptericola sp. b408]
MSDSRIASASELGVLATLRRGLEISPQIVQGLWVTLALAVLAAAGRVVVPLAVQRTVDDGILADGGPDASQVLTLTLLAAGAIVVAGLCTAVVNVRLFRRTEAGLATLRVRAFRHVHDLSTLSQGSERRGALVSRVTTDVDQISHFVQWGGIMLLVSTLQIAVATALMAVYSPALTAVVWLCFVPLFVILRYAQRSVGRAFGRSREKVGAMLAAVSESVVGAETVRAYGVEARTGRRIDAAIDEARRTQGRALLLVASVFSSGTFMATLVLAVVVVVGSYLGIGGGLTAGQLVAFLFLVQLFTGPVQMATEILNELQNAVAGWRRVLAVVETPLDVVDAGADGVDSPRGDAHVALRGVRYAYPDGPEVLHGVDLELPARRKVAVVGQTGSGKTTIAKLVARLMDPTDGRVELDGVDLRRIPLARLRERVVLVPQEGFLFDGTVLSNVAYGLPEAAPEDPEVRARVAAAFEALGLTDWVAGLPAGLDTDVGQRGEALSAGERQLVAVARAYLAAPDLLVLDEATSAVDPATEVRIARALDALTSGRSTITIAHRLSTAEASDLVVVVDDGHVVEVGPHEELAAAGGVYARMHASWVAQTR